MEYHDRLRWSWLSTAALRPLPHCASIRAPKVGRGPTRPPVVPLRIVATLRCAVSPHNSRWSLCRDTAPLRWQQCFAVALPPHAPLHKPAVQRNVLRPFRCFAGLQRGAVLPSNSTAPLGRTLPLRRDAPRTPAGIVARPCSVSGAPKLRFLCRHYAEQRRRETCCARFSAVLICFVAPSVAKVLSSARSPCSVQLCGASTSCGDRSATQQHYARSRTPLFARRVQPARPPHTAAPSAATWRVFAAGHRLGALPAAPPFACLPRALAVWGVARPALPPTLGCSGAGAQTPWRGLPTRARWAFVSRPCPVARPRILRSPCRGRVAGRFALPWRGCAAVAARISAPRHLPPALGAPALNVCSSRGGRGRLARALRGKAGAAWSAAI